MDNVLQMRMQEGAYGYGIYLMILEQLRDADGYTMRYDPAVLAWALHESDQQRVERVCTNYGLFEISEDGMIKSPWLISAMSLHDDRRAKLSAAGKKSAEKRAAVNNHVETMLNTPPQHGCNDVAAVEQQTKETNKPNPIQIEQKPQPSDEEEWSDYSDDDIKSLTHSKSVLFDPTEHDEWIQKMDGCNPNPLAAAGVAYKMRLDQVTALYEMMQGCRIGSPRLMAFIASLKHCQQSKFVPDHPFAYFAAQLKALPMA